LFCYGFIFAIKSYWIIILHLSFLFLVFLVSQFGFGIRLTIVFILVKKSCNLGYFCACDNLNRFPSSPFLLFCFCYPFVSKSCLHQWKKPLLSLGILNRKIKQISRICYSFVNQLNFNLFGMCFFNIIPTKGATNQPIRQVWWHMFKVLRFCQPSVFGHLISFSSISNWPSPSWTHWHFIVKHNLCLVHTFIGTSITFVEWLQSIYLKVQYHHWKFR
jgi:hypothetical protein